MQSLYGAPPTIDVVLDLISQSRDRVPISKFYISPQTNYEQLIASIRILSVVLLDLEDIYVAEQKRLKAQRTEAAQTGSTLSTVAQTELIKGPLKRLASAIQACDAKICEFGSRQQIEENKFCFDLSLLNLTYCLD